MKTITMAWCLVFLAVLTGFAAAEDGGSLKVTIDGFNNDRGDAKIALFNSKEMFAAGDKGVRGAALPIKDGKAEWVVADLPFGIYAIKVFHDENSNGKLDKNVMGMPKEQYGFSNNARGTFGPPEYDHAKFTFSRTHAAITITVE